MERKSVQRKYIDLTQAHQRQIDSGIDPSQICRVCSRNARRAVFACQPTAEADKGFMRVIDERGTQAVVHPDGSVPVVLSKKPDGSPRSPIRAFVGFDGAETNAFGLMVTCGQSIAPKCRDCAHFVPTEASYFDPAAEPSPRPRLRQVTVGGHCDIGVGGLVVNGAVAHCVFTPKGQVVSESEKHSCGTCAWKASDWFVMDHAAPLDIDLNAYERAQIEARYDQADPESVKEMNFAIGRARKARAQRPHPVLNSKRLVMTWQGYLRCYRMFIAPGGLGYRTRRGAHGETEAVLSSVTVFIPGTSSTVTLDADNGDDRLGLVEVINDHLAFVRIMAPHHRDLGLDDRAKVAYTGFVGEACALCDGTGVLRRAGGALACPECDSGAPFARGRAVISAKPAHLVGRRSALPGPAKRSGPPPLAHLIDAECVKRGADRTSADYQPSGTCHPRHGPCYFHAKAPRLAHFARLDPDGSFGGEYAEIVFDAPAGAFGGVRTDDGPERRLHLERTPGAPVAAVDANGDPAHPNVMKLRMRSWWAWAADDAERAALLAQMDAALAAPSGPGLTAAPTQARAMRLEAFRESRIDMGHPYCALAQADTAAGGSPARAKGTAPAGQWLGHKWDPSGGILIRGIDMTRAWNDAFGTPRYKQSTNPVMEAYSGGGVAVLGGHFADSLNGPIWVPNTVANGSWLRSDHGPGPGEGPIPQRLVVDPFFSWPKYQERMEWERTHNPGATLAQEMNINAALLAIGISAGRSWQSNPAAVVAPLHRGEFVLPLAELAGVTYSGVSYYYSVGDEEVDHFSSPAQLVDWLDRTVWVSGSDDTALGGFFISNRARLFGYSLMGSADMGQGEVPRPGANVLFDLPGPARWRSGPRGDETTEAMEEPEMMICSVCFSGDGDAGVFHPGELVDATACPSGDGGVLVRWMPKAEWLAAATSVDADQIRTYVDPTYRRSPNSDMAFAADGTEWRRKLRLDQMSCEHWSAKRRW